MERAGNVPSMAQRLEGLLKSDGGCERGTELQAFCREMWDLLARGRDVGDTLLRGFVRLLQDVDDLALASLVIPDLRTGAGTPEPALQREVVERTSDARARMHALHESTQGDHDSQDGPFYSFYAAEKRIFQEAEVYRAKLLLFHGGALSPEETEQVRRWIDACPIKAGSGGRSEGEGAS